MPKRSSAVTFLLISLIGISLLDVSASSPIESAGQGTSSKEISGLSRTLRDAERISKDQSLVDKDTRSARRDERMSKSEETSAIKAAEKGEERRALSRLQESQRYEDKAIRAQAQANTYGKDELRRSREMEGQLQQGMRPAGGVSETERKDIRKEERFVGTCLGRCMPRCSAKCGDDASCMKMCENKCRAACSNYESANSASDVIREQEMTGERRLRRRKVRFPFDGKKMDEACRGTCMDKCSSGCKSKSADPQKCHAECDYQCRDNCFIDEGGRRPDPDVRMDGDGEEGLGHRPTQMMRQCMGECNNFCVPKCESRKERLRTQQAQSTSANVKTMSINCTRACRRTCLGSCKPKVQERISVLRQDYANRLHPFYGRERNGTGVDGQYPPGDWRRNTFLGSKDQSFGFGRPRRGGASRMEEDLGQRGGRGMGLSARQSSSSWLWYGGLLVVCLAGIGLGYYQWQSRRWRKGRGAVMRSL
uniref:Uncharacterized protein n=1 Tax=Hanusia phi TaxID=3032 RepID=A0A7S0ERA1_9CRYP|mmetsp:Transcript_29668/g.67139  ORF Transcript_29668/g.67139 Transcript_29668/m.67139 type:complete len:479 (+) Transcript_29668:1-1437(+)